MKKIQIGNRQCTQVQPIRDSTSLLEQQEVKELQERLHNDGYLFLRGVISSKKAVAAQKTLLQQLEERKYVTDGLQMRARGLEGIVVDAETGGSPNHRESDVDEWKHVGHSKALRDVYAGSDLKRLYALLFNNKYKMLTSCTWMRMKGDQEVTAEHADLFYFQKATNIFFTHWPYKEKVDDQCCHVCHKDQDEARTMLCSGCDRAVHTYCAKLPDSYITEYEDWFCKECLSKPFPFYTCWICLSECPYPTEGGGVLCVSPGSHRLEGFDKPLKKDLLQGEVDLDTLQWHTILSPQQKLQPGDVILFNIKLVHAASKNSSGCFRLSLDTRVVAL